MIEYETPIVEGKFKGHNILFDKQCHYIKIGNMNFVIGQQPPKG